MIDGLILPRSEKTWTWSDFAEHAVGTIMVLGAVALFYLFWFKPFFVFITGLNFIPTIYLMGTIFIGLMGFVPLTQGRENVKYLTPEASEKVEKVMPWIGLVMMLVAGFEIFGPLFFGFWIVTMWQLPDGLVMVTAMMVGIMGLMFVTQTGNGEAR